MNARTRIFITTAIALAALAFSSLPAFAQTPLPPTSAVLTVTTGADGTIDNPNLVLKALDGSGAFAYTLNQPGDLAPGATNSYSFSLPGAFCDYAQFELTKPGGDDWGLRSLTLTLNGLEVWTNTAYSSPITGSGFSGGNWVATSAYRSQCGALAWTLVEVRLVTGADGTTDTLTFELSGSFPGSPYAQSLAQPGALGAGQTDDFVFIVPMEFCEMTGFRILKPGDDNWQLEEIYLSIDATEVFFNKDASVFSPVTASSFPPNGGWSGTAAYQSRCSSGGSASAGALADLSMLDPKVLSILLTPIPPNIDPQLLSPIVVQAIQPLAIQSTPTIPPPPPPPGQQTNVTPTIPPPPGAQGQGAQQTTVTCPGFLPSRLIAGQQARVTPGDANTLRDQPSTQGNRIGSIPGGATILVIAGPQCGANGIAWWQVNYNGILGWTAEGQGSVYWIEPLTTGGQVQGTQGGGSANTNTNTNASGGNAPPPPPPPPPPLPSGGQSGQNQQTGGASGTLRVGGKAVVTQQGNQLRIRTIASTTGGVVGQLTTGMTVDIIGGSTSAEGFVWWQIRAPNGDIGWVAQGSGADMYLVGQ